MTATITTHRDLINRMMMKTAGKSFGANQWGERHRAAFACPNQSPERGIVQIINAAADYADWHKERYESGIGEDGFLGSAWEQIIRACLTLLNGECGNLDCGTTDGLLRSMLELEGFKDE